MVGRCGSWIRGDAMICKVVPWYRASKYTNSLSGELNTPSLRNGGGLYRGRVRGCEPEAVESPQ